MPDTHADQVLARHKLTVHEYHRMGEAGILRPDQRVELIDEELIDMAPIGSNHQPGRRCCRGLS
jgi:Uma2 family endonuclease